MLHARCLPSACLCEYQFRSNYSFFSPKSFPIAGSSREKIRQLIIMRSTVQWTEKENAFPYPLELTFFCVIEKKVKKSEKEKGPVHPLAFGFGFEKTMARVAHRIGLCINLTKLSHKFRTKSLLSLKIESSLVNRFHPIQTAVLWKENVESCGSKLLHQGRERSLHSTKTGAVFLCYHFRPCCKETFGDFSFYCKKKITQRKWEKSEENVPLAPSDNDAGSGR